MCQALSAGYAYFVVCIWTFGCVGALHAASPEASALWVKTNVLYDFSTLPNVAVEWPMGRHASMAVNYLCPWWKDKNNAWATQVLDATAEWRWWPQGNPRYRRDRGAWYCGALAGGGDYDWERHERGFQGEFVRAGVTVGYHWPLTQRWAFEVGAGAGAFWTKYRRYHAEYEGRYLVWKYSGRYQWYGPTDLRMTLIYNLLGRKGGAR
jgi:hypothetical protein